MDSHYCLDSTIHYRNHNHLVSWDSVPLLGLCCPGIQVSSLHIKIPGHWQQFHCNVCPKEESGHRALHGLWGCPHEFISTVVVQVCPLDPVGVGRHVLHDKYTLTFQSPKPWIPSSIGDQGRSASLSVFPATNDTAGTLCALSRHSKE